MNNYNFEKVTNRKGSNSMKWDKVDALYQGEGLLPLWVADMDFKVPDDVIEALHTKVSHGIFGYPKHSKSTDTAVVNWLKNQFNWDVNESSIVFTSGVVPTISQIIQAFTQLEDEIIIQTPVYPPFFSLVKNNQRKLLTNPLLYLNGTYTMDLEHLESIITDKTKMLILCSPHNPVGRVWRKEELEALASICCKHDLLVISDEIHADLVYEGRSHIPLASISEDMAKRTFTCLAATKTFNLAEFHTSYVVVENNTLRAGLIKQLTSQFLNMTNSFGELVTEVAYTHGETWLQELRSYIKGNYEYLKSFIDEKMPNLTIVDPEGTYLVWIDCSNLPFTAAERKNWLVNVARVALNHGPTFGEDGNQFERLNLACRRKTLEEGLNRIYHAYQKILF